MPGPVRLEVFDIVPAPGGAQSDSLAGEIEEARLAAFEAGYRAGWDDASAARQDEDARLREDLARNLQALSFTFHEARAHVLAALGPLVSDMAAVLLPEIARASLPHLVAEALGPFAEMAADAPVRVLVHPDAAPAVRALLPDDASLPLTVVEDASLAAGAVRMLLGAVETRLDTDAALGAIRAALSDFLTLNTMEP
ncbi:MAG: flagellar biosynthesis protein [Gemmobacter sp.]